MSMQSCAAAPSKEGRKSALHAASKALVIVKQNRAAMAGVPAVRVASRLELAKVFSPCSPTSSVQYLQRRGSAGRPPAMMADIWVVIRRHFPAVVVGPGGYSTRTVEKVAQEIELRRRASRKLRGPERVERVLAEEVLPLVRHKYDRGAVAAASREICAYVSAACADARVAQGGVHVLVVVDTFACPVLFRAAPPPPCNPMTIMMPSEADALKNFFATTTSDPCMELKSGMPAKEARRSIGVIGDGRPKPPVELEERFKGWLPW